MSRQEKTSNKKEKSLKKAIEAKMKESGNNKLDEYLERGDSLTKGDLLRLAKGVAKEQIDKKVPAPLKKTPDPTGLSAPGRKTKSSSRKARRAENKQAKRLTKFKGRAMGLASFAFALLVGILYKVTAKM